MKKVSKVIILIISFLMIYSLSFAGDTCDSNTKEPKENQVFFFEHINYGGCWMGNNAPADMASIEGESYMPACGKRLNWNNTISSIKVGAKAKVTIYEDVNFKGRSQTFKGSCNAPLCLKDLRSSNWNDKISSYRVDWNYDCD